MEDHYRRVVVLLWVDMFAGYVIWIMPTYLTNVWKLDFTHASAIQNVYSGLTKFLPFFFVLVVDAFLSNVWLLVLSTISYTAGLGLLSMSTPPILSNSTGTCSAYKPECVGQTQKALFYTSLALIAVGVSGHIVSLVAFASDQMTKEQNTTTSTTKETDPQDAQFQPVDAMISLLTNYGKKSFRIFLTLLVPVAGIIALPYVKPWSIRFGVPAICSVVATFLFFTGFCCGGYSTQKKPQESLLINIVKVLIASTCKISLHHPEDVQNLYKYDEYEGKHYPGLRFLEKAAIVEGDDDDDSKRWKLCTVSQVEDTKIAIRMIPFWISFILSGVITSIGNTYFVEQANHLNYKIGKVKLPITILLIVYEYSKLLFSKPFSTNNRYAPAIGMILAVLCCITASKVENRRIDVITDHGLINKPDAKIPMSAYWLLPQYILLAGHDSLMENSIAGFFSDEASLLMKKYIVYMTQGITGIGIVGSVLSVYIVGRVSERRGRTNWFQETLNKSRLDNYYWVLAVLSAVNFVWYVFAATMYRSRKR